MKKWLYYILSLGLTTASAGYLTFKSSEIRAQAHRTPIVLTSNPENIYKVKKGRSLKYVSVKTDIPLNDLVKCNPQLKPNTRLRPEQEVKLYITYKIKDGDTLLDIKNKTGTTLPEILNYNKIDDPDKIYAGSWLKLPCRDTNKKKGLEGLVGEHENGVSIVKKKISKGIKEIKFPSGLKLKVVHDKSLTEKGKEFYDPNDSGSPLLEVPRNALYKKVSPHFYLAEFAGVNQPKLIDDKYTQKVQGDTYYKYIRLDPKLVEGLEKLMKKTGKILDIDSGYRPYGYNIRQYLAKGL